VSELPELLERAFLALSGEATRREFGLVAKTLLDSGDVETLDLLERAREGGEAKALLDREATALGSNPFVVLDLVWAIYWAREKPWLPPEKLLLMESWR